MLQKRNKVVVGQNSHSGFAFAIICAQFFFLFPVCGIWGPDYRSLKFRWNSFRCLTVYAFQIVLICYSSLTILFFSELGINLSNIVSLFFSVSATLMSILLLVLSRDWPGLMKKWAGVDRAMRTYGYPRNLNRKLKMAFGIVMVPAMTEHVCSVAAYFFYFPISGKSCMDIINDFLLRVHIAVFKRIPYNIFLGILCQMTYTCNTFAYNYLDTILILLSLSLIARFQQINERIKSAVHTKVEDLTMWMAIREDYNRLNELTKSVDDALSNVILLTFLNNIFILTMQLFQMLRPVITLPLMSKIYFSYSFTFLMARIIWMSINVAKVEIVAKEPVEILSSLPHYIYNEEVERILFQIKYDPVSFTGKRFFRITKSTILFMAGVIVSYELIFMQYNGIKAVDFANITALKS